MRSFAMHDMYCETDVASWPVVEIADIAAHEHTIRAGPDSIRGHFRHAQTGRVLEIQCLLAGVICLDRPE